MNKGVHPRKKCRLQGSRQCRDSAEQKGETDAARSGSITTPGRDEEEPRKRGAVAIPGRARRACDARLGKEGAVVAGIARYWVGIEYKATGWIGRTSQWSSGTRLWASIIGDVEIITAMICSRDRRAAISVGMAFLLLNCFSPHPSLQRYLPMCVRT